jgi:iron complex outermembrane receptor protein
LRKDFDNGMRFEFAYNYGRTDIDTTNRNSRVEDRFFAAVDAVIDPATGQPVCRSTLDPSATPPLSPFPAAREGFLTFTPGEGSTCRPINLFGTDSITTADRGFAFIDTTETSTIEQTQILATLAGDTENYFSLPAGAIYYAVGFEYREESSDFTPPELEIAGLLYNTLGEARGIVNGEYDVTEFFGEISVPLLADLPLVESLTLDASYRNTDHSTAGTINTYGTGLVWQPVQDLRVRGSYNRAVRAPNIFELFSPAQPAFLNVQLDPCNPQNINAGTSFRRENCLQFVDPGFDAADFLSARTAGSTGGNPNLEAEEADTYTFGVVYEPGFLEGLALTIDYYEIVIEQAIDSLAGVDIANLCVDLPTIQNVYCDAVTRDPNRGNAIVDFTSGNVNLGAFETDGIDVGITYDMSLSNLFGANAGSLRHSLLWNHVFNNSEFPDPLDRGFELPDLGQLGVPENIVNYNLNYYRENLSISYQVRWQSSQFNSGVTPEDVAGNPIFADPLNTGDAFVHDMSFRFDVTDFASITGGINNLTNEEPFLGTYIRPVDTLGRTFFLGVQGVF